MAHPTTNEPRTRIFPVLALALGLTMLIGSSKALSAAPPTTVLAMPPRLELRVNVPAFRLDAIVDGEVLASFPVTVGSPPEPTPDGRFEVDRVVWNPWWHPPTNRRPGERVTPPGPTNPMGRVKLHFAADLYFLHGTSKLDEVGHATSRGCIRLSNEDAIALSVLVQELAGPALRSDERTLLMRNTRETRTYRLERAVPLTIAYDLVEVVDGQIALHEDVYDRAVGRSTVELVRAALDHGSVRPGNLDLPALAAALQTVEAGRPLPLERFALRSPTDRILLTSAPAPAGSSSHE